MSFLIRQKNVHKKLSGVIRERLKDKCIANGIELIEINSRDTGAICSSCGEKGIRKNLVFHCKKCNPEISGALNSAKNIENKYQKQ
ncbi:MAG: zinc ribbon domain-containing protein [Oscillospiraceae bacterium]